MATSGKDIQQTVTTNLEQKGGEALEKTLERIFKNLDALSKSGKGMSPIFKDIGDAAVELAKGIHQNKLEADAVTLAVAKIENAMRALSTLSKAERLFSKAEEDQIKKINADLKEIQKIQDKINKQAQEETGRYADARAKGLRQEREELEKIAALKAKQNRDNQRQVDTGPKSAKASADVFKEEIARQEAIAKAREDQNRRQARNVRYAMGLDERDTTGDARRSASVFMDVMAEEKRQQAILDMQRKYRQIQFQELEKQRAQEAKPSAGQRALQNRAELATGEGAASLLLIQGALMANSALINGAISAIKATIDFSVQLEASFRNVQAVIGATNTEMGGLENVIKQVSMTTKFSAIEVADAALSLGQAGLSAKQIAESIQPVITLANAAGSTVAQAVDLVTSVVGVFDKNSSDVADVANKITQAANGSKVSVDKLALGFQYAGNTAAQMGISFEETTAAMAAMSNAGIKSGSTMGTGLRQFLTEVQKPSDDFLVILQRLGLSISDLDFRSKGFIGVIKTLKEAGFVASDAIQSFDVRGAAAFNALLARPDDLQNQYDALAGSNAAMKANEIQMNSLSAQSSRLTNTLGAMASTGFEPVLQSLTALIRLLTDGLSGVAEFSGGLKFLGTILAGLAAGAAVSWIAPLLGGIGTIITTLGAGGPLIAAFSGVAAMTAGVAAGVMALVAAYSIYNELVTSTAKSIDAYQGSLDKARGAAQEKAEAITSLNNRLEILNNRESELTKDTDAFKTQVNETNEIMIRWGYTTDGASSSLETLRGRIYSVRKELEQMRFADMQQAATEAGKVFNAQQQQMEERRSTLGWTINRTSKFTNGKVMPGQEEFLNSIQEPARREQFQKQLDGFRRGEGFKPEDSARNLELERAMNTFRADPKNLNFFTRGEFDLFRSSLSNFNSSVSEVRQSKRILDKAQDDLDVDQRARSFTERLKANTGVDMDTSFSSTNLAAEAKRRLSDADKNDPVKLNQATRDLTAETRKRFEQARDAGLAEAKNDSERAIVNQKFTTAVEEMTKGFRSTGAAAQAELKIRNDYSSDDEEFRGIKNGIKRGLSESEKERGRELIRKKYRDKFEEDTVTMGDGRQREGLRLKSEREAKYAIEDFENSIQDAAASAGSRALKSQESSFRALIEAKMREAKSFRGRASASTPIDDLADLMNKGLDKIAEAKKMELGSISRQYSPNSIEYKNLTEAAIEKYDAASQSFIGSFSGLFETVTKRTYDLTNAVKEFDKKIKQWANETQEKVYRDMAPSRANDLQNAINTGPVSGRNRSDVDTYLNNRAREPIDLAATRSAIGDNLVDTARITSELQMLETKAAETRAKFEELNAAKAKFLNGRDTDTLSVEDSAVYRVIADQITPLRDQLLAGETGIEKVRDRLQNLRKERDSLQLREAGLTPSPEAETSWDNLAASAEKTWKAYNQFVGTQSVFKTLENGMFSSLQGIGGQIGNFFSSVTQGTATVGQAFRTMAGNIIKSMADVLAQALAMQAVKSILGAFAGVAAGGGITASPVTFGSGTGLAATSFTGGAVAPVASFTGYADGGPIVGGIPGKDSVPVAAMPGEFMIKKSAVDALGMDYMNHLNNTTSRATSSVSTPAVGPALKSAMSGGGGLVNVWIVSPDQMGSAGPNDVVATISDDINRGGPIKKLIKAVQMGA